MGSGLLALNVAVTLRSDVIESEQVFDVGLLSQPLHDAVEFTPGLAVSVTEAPDVYMAIQPLGHEMPDGVLLTDPVAPPAVVTESVRTAADAAFATFLR